jgi:branched-chain amino acid transport system permease protein
MIWVNALVQGVLLGGLYALLAAGLSLMFGVMRIVNLAHGVLALGAAYLGYVLVDHTGVSPFLALLVVVPVMGVVGYALQWGLLNRALAKGGLAPLLATFGVAIVLVQLMQEEFSADSRTLQVGSIGIKSFSFGNDIFVGWFQLIVLLTGVAVIVALQLFLNKTRTGRAMRACSDDVETVRLMGIDNRRIYALATALAIATVGLAGMFLGMRTQFTPASGDMLLIFAFEAVIIGGLGSLWGTLLGAIVLGVAQVVGAQVDPAYGVLIGHLVFLAVLAFRPAGLLPKTVTA